MAIGYACLTTGLNNISSFKSIKVANVTEDKLHEIIQHNLEVLKAIIQYNIKNQILLFRISSDIIPLASHSINKLPWHIVFQQQLEEIGTIIKTHGMRVSMHPGQYTVLNSPNSEVVKKAVDDLNYHCLFLDSLNVDSTCKIVLHIGGVYHDKTSAIQRFIDNYEYLSTSLKSRLVIENDDKSYHINDVLCISNKLNIPVIFDNLHHQIYHETIGDEIEIIRAVSKTWKNCDGRQKIHYSMQAEDKKPGSHSNTIAARAFKEFYDKTRHLDLDIMLEVKDKNLSAIKTKICCQTPELKYLEQEWSKYKYIVLEHSPKIYLEIRNYLKLGKNTDAVDFYEKIEQALKIEVTINTQRNAFDHIWGYFKNVCTVQEKLLYLKKLDGFNNQTISNTSMKKYLLKLATKYQSTYLLQSYYFHF